MREAHCVKMISHWPFSTSSRSRDQFILKEVKTEELSVHLSCICSVLCRDLNRGYLSSNIWGKFEGCNIGFDKRGSIIML